MGIINWFTQCDYADPNQGMARVYVIIAVYFVVLLTIILIHEWRKGR